MDKGTEQQTAAPIAGFCITGFYHGYGAAYGAEDVAL